MTPVSGSTEFDGPSAVPKKIRGASV